MSYVQISHHRGQHVLTQQYVAAAYIQEPLICELPTAQQFTSFIAIGFLQYGELLIGLSSLALLLGHAGSLLSVLTFKFSQIHILQISQVRVPTAHNNKRYKSVVCGAELAFMSILVSISHTLFTKHIAHTHRCVYEETD